MRLTIIDTLTTVVFFTVLAALTELYIAGMEPLEVLRARLIMVPMMVLTGRPYGAWRDWFFAATKPTVSWSKSLIDGLAFLTFQLPVYGLTLWIAGAAQDEILTLLATTAVLMLIVSRPFGLVLETTRKFAGVKADKLIVSEEYTLGPDRSFAALSTNVCSGPKATAGLISANGRKVSHSSPRVL